MAIYHFSAQVISRSQGRSSVGAAAYRAAERLLDERTGQVHDFTRKQDVLQSEILLPVGAPPSFADRSTLWNAVELSEKRKDAQVAREINISLPRELSLEQNWALLTSFVQSEFVDKGMVADVAFHQGHRGEEQPHGHVMLCLRDIEAGVVDSVGSIAGTATATEAGFGQKVRAWNDRGLLSDWREHWAEACNRGLALAGFEVRVDHRTLEAQGIPLEAQRKIGPVGTFAGQRRLSEHQERATRNGERLMAEPEIALSALTRQHSTFTHQDLARFVSRHTVDAEQFEVVYEAIKAHPALVLLGRDDAGLERLTTREMLALETRIVEQAMGFASMANHVCSSKHVAQVRDSKGLSDEQQEAFTHLVEGKDIACVIGFAGTGKSYLLGAAREAWEASGYRVQGVTLSGIAAENLEGSSGIGSRTVASRLWHWERDRERLGASDILVVDEAGMLGSRQMARVIDEVHRAGAKVVLIGDPEQLQAIEAGAAYRAIAERVGYVEMTEIRRQREAWQQQATRDFASERTVEGLMAYEQHDNVHTFVTKDAAMAGLIEQWDEVRNQRGTSERSSPQTQLILAYTRAEVGQLNERARAIRKAQGELGTDQTVETARGERVFAEGDRIYFLRNEARSLGVKNGTLGTIDRMEGDRFAVRLDQEAGSVALEKGDRETRGRVVEFSLKDYNDIDHGYAATVYKAQGVTVDRTHVLASQYFDRHSTYVALSRHREGADLYVSREEFPSVGNLTRVLSRERTKDVTLDYSQERGLEPLEGVHSLQTEHESLGRQDERYQEKVIAQKESYVVKEDAYYEDLLKKSFEDLKAQEKAFQKEVYSSSALSDSLSSSTFSRSFQHRHDFTAFKQQFEAEHPERASVLKESIRPGYEKIALEAQERIEALEKSVEQSKQNWFGSEKEVDALEKYAASLSKESAVMTYFKEHNRELSKKIETLAKSHQAKELSLERDWDERSL